MSTGGDTPGGRVRAVVVGAGVSGAFAADALRRELGARLDLTVLEGDDRIGGRALQREIAGIAVETGASLFHSANRLLTDAASALGLSAVDAGTGSALGIWDGTRWVLRTTGGRLDQIRLALRYRRPLLLAGKQVRGLVDRLDVIYPRLAAGDSWESPELLLRELGLFRASQIRADQHFTARRFRTEFVDGVSRNNYAQDSTGLNALVDLVSLAGAGLGGGTLRRVAEGNAAIPDGLLHRSGARSILDARARSVRPEGDGWRITGTGFDPIVADVVVLAAPLEHADIALEGAKTPPARQFATVHVTFVQGTLRLGAERDNRAAPDFILTTATAGSLLSIERIVDTTSGALYKVFSTEPLADERIAELFVPRTVIRLSWSAYPLLPPTSRWPGFRLAPGLYYTGAMEYAVSTMETQAIGGVAVANLLMSDLAKADPAERAR